MDISKGFEEACRERFVGQGFAVSAQKKQMVLEKGDGSPRFRVHLCLLDKYSPVIEPLASLWFDKIEDVRRRAKGLPVQPLAEHTANVAFYRLAILEGRWWELNKDQKYLQKWNIPLPEPKGFDPVLDQIAEGIAKLANPFFESLSTVEKLDDYFNASNDPYRMGPYLAAQVGVISRFLDGRPGLDAVIEFHRKKAVQMGAVELASFDRIVEVMRKERGA